MKKNKNVIVKENTSTPTLPTTRYYIKSWGYFNKKHKILIEQVNPSLFFIKIKDKQALCPVEEIKDFSKEKPEVLGRGFIYQDILFLFNNSNVYDGRMFYNIPEKYKFEQFLKGDLKILSYEVLNEKLSLALKTMFDFSDDTDITTSSLAIGQSWLKPWLNEFFFYGIDATKGGGKTTLGEIVYFLMRHGFVGGNISMAAIPRLIEELDLNIFIDEIDQQLKDEDIPSILRKGQRRGNPYVRCEGRNHRPVAYDVSGIHGYSYRSEIEDAFMDRSLRIHTTKSMDSRLPIINSYKKEILKSLADELFFWYLENIFVVGCSKESGVGSISLDKEFLKRDSIFSLITKNLSESELNILKSVFGRDSELTFLCFNVSRHLGLDFIEEIQKVIHKKKEDSQTSDNFYFETLKEFILSKLKTLKLKILKDGNNIGVPFYPKSLLYQEFIKYLRELQVLSIGTKKFNSLLRDLGFMEGINIRSQRYFSYPSACLIFTEDLMLKLDHSANYFESVKILEDFE